MEWSAELISLRCYLGTPLQLRLCLRSTAGAKSVQNLSADSAATNVTNLPAAQHAETQCGTLRDISKICRLRTVCIHFRDVAATLVGANLRLYGLNCPQQHHMKRRSNSLSALRIMWINGCEEQIGTSSADGCSTSHCQLQAANAKRLFFLRLFILFGTPFVRLDKCPSHHPHCQPRAYAQTHRHRKSMKIVFPKHIILSTQMSSCLAVPVSRLFGAFAGLSVFFLPWVRTGIAPLPGKFHYRMCGHNK